MSHISVHVRMRPIRFGFLVRPNDYKHTLEIFRANTCLWGGKFNPIIPYFKQVPRWWDRHSHRFETAAQIINGYLDFFQPDFIVEAESGLADGLGFNKERVLQLSDLLMRDDGRDWNRNGLSVLDLYRDMYRKEFQFARRHEHDIIDVVPEEIPLTGFCACLFGAFPVESDFAHFSSAFTDAFGPKKVTLNGAALAKLYETGFSSAIRIGHSKIETDYYDHGDPVLFVLDAHDSRDLIDYWNLRAIMRTVIPVPVQWLEDLSAFSKKFIIKNYRPLPGNQYGVMIHPTVMFARSVPTDDIERIHTEHFRVDVAEANLRQDSYPSIWRHSSMPEKRPMLSAAEKTNEVPVVSDKPAIQFDTLHPEFAAEFGNETRWANVIKLRDRTSSDQIATVYPCDYKNPSYPNFTPYRHEPLLPTMDGFVIFPRSKNVLERWELPDGTTAINSWLKTQGIKTVMSDAGRSTQQIIQTLGGFSGVSSFTSAGVVKLLNKISRSTSRSAHHDEFKNRIKDAIGNKWRGKYCFESLVKLGAVELGLEVKCTKCSSWSWYSLKQIEYQLNCSLCLRQFEFPIIDPGASNNSRWAYRLIGPFALPDYASGGYAASLSIRFFSQTLNGCDQAVTWSSGLKLELSPVSEVESDYIIWYQREQFYGKDHPPELIFGEAKSFGEDVFKVDDIERMKKLAARFPGSVLVLSTMKQADEVSKEEISRISKLAEWGREYIREIHQTRARVIVLTGKELFASSSLRDVWKETGGRHTELIQHGMVRPENLSVLANLTQQLYLNMPSYGAWHETKRKKRAARIKARSAKASGGQ